MKENQKIFSNPVSETNHFNFFDSPYVKSSTNLLPNDDSEAQNDQGSDDESPHVDGTESLDSEATHNVDGTESAHNDSEATHNVDGTESSDSEATHNVDGTESVHSDSGATLDELVTTSLIDHNIVELNSTSEGNGINIHNVDHEPMTQRRSGRTSKLPTKFSDFVLDSKVKYGIDKVVNYSKLSKDNYCFSTNLNKSFEPNTFHEACKYKEFDHCHEY